MESDVKKMLQSLADSASGAADGAKNAMHNMGKAVAEKYDTVRLSMELAQLHTQQEQCFVEIGRTMFRVKAGVDSVDVPNAKSGKTPQENIGALLLDAAKIQLEMDSVNEQLATIQNRGVCPSCGQACNEKDQFCAACGAKLAQRREE